MGLKVTGVDEGSELAGWSVGAEVLVGKREGEEEGFSVGIMEGLVLGEVDDCVEGLEVDELVIGELLGAFVSPNDVGALEGAAVGAAVRTYLT